MSSNRVIVILGCLILFFLSPVLVGSALIGLLFVYLTLSKGATITRGKKIDFLE